MIATTAARATRQRALGLAGLAVALGILPSGCASTRATESGSTPPKAVTAAAESKPSDSPPDLSLSQRVKVHIDLGRAHETQNDWQAALEEYQKALELADAPGGGILDHRERTGLKSQAHRRMGAALDRAGRFDQAGHQFRTALELTPRDANVWNDFGYSHYLQGRYDEAETALRAGLKIAPKDPRLLTNLGLVLAAKGDADAAVESITRADGAASAHLAVGYVLASTGRAEESRSHFEKARQLQPGLKPATIALAKLDGHDRLGPDERPRTGRPTQPTQPVVQTGHTATPTTK